MEELNLNNTADVKRAVLDSPNVVCECGCKTFTAAVVLKRLPALYSGTGKEELMDIPVYVCTECGKVPGELKKNKNFAKIFGESESENKAISL